MVVLGASRQHRDANQNKKTLTTALAVQGMPSWSCVYTLLSKAQGRDYTVSCASSEKVKKLNIIRN